MNRESSDGVLYFREFGSSVVVDHQRYSRERTLKEDRSRVRRGYELVRIYPAYRERGTGSGAQRCAISSTPDETLEDTVYTALVGKLG
jgi:hypothetical protein